MKYTLYSIFLSVLLFLGCEDVIDLELEETSPVLVVDGWINNLPDTQRVVLNFSQNYFDNSRPDGITDAVVTLMRNDGVVFDFNHVGEGIYEWFEANDSLGVPGHEFELRLEVNNEIYSSYTEMKRVPAIDSIGVELREDEIFIDDGLYAQFYARDFSGSGDTYWIKTYRNGLYLDKTQELNIAYDAGFDAGTGVDGLIFIPPIREAVNPLDEDLLPTPYDPGDEIRVEIHSMTVPAFNFLEIARDQINNGDNGIFSIPLANTRTNITAPGDRVVLGFFNVAAVAKRSQIIEAP